MLQLHAIRAEAAALAPARGASFVAARELVWREGGWEAEGAVEADFADEGVRVGGKVRGEGVGEEGGEGSGWGEGGEEGGGGGTGEDGGVVGLLAWGGGGG